MPSFYEFFAGGGMARAGLGGRWQCLFANDFDPKKGMTYQVNWGAHGELRVGDVGQIKVADVPDHADLIWGSFPCQDLSLAGGGAGLKGERSGTFYPFWKLVKGLIADDRAPKVIALENVCGTLTSHEGKDFKAICQTFARADYLYGALVLDAALFVPQSRPRLFFIAVHKDVKVDPVLISPGPIHPFHTRGLCKAFDNVPRAGLENMVWWNLPTPPQRRNSFFGFG